MFSNEDCYNNERKWIKKFPFTATFLLVTRTRSFGGNNMAERKEQKRVRVQFVVITWSYGMVALNERLHQHWPEPQVHRAPLGHWSLTDHDSDWLDTGQLRGKLSQLGCGRGTSMPPSWHWWPRGQDALVARPSGIELEGHMARLTPVSPQGRGADLTR